MLESCAPAPRPLEPLGDSHTAPADVVRWYRDHGHGFIVFTDHNAITMFDAPPGMLAIPGAELT